MRLALIAAFDRYNYGDLLMPIVFESFLDKYYPSSDFEYVYFAQKQKEMEYAGGVNTVEIKKLYNAEIKVDAAVVVGGEILSANYYEMYMNVQENKLKIIIFKIAHRLFKKKTNEICKHALNGKTGKPWIIDSEVCGKIIYNTVGGNLFYDGVIDKDQQNEIRRNLKESSYISIRDSSSLKANEQLLPEHTKFFPDSVLIMSRLFSNQHIQDRMTKNFKGKIDSYSNFFVLQVNKSIGMDLVNQLATEIDEIKSTLNMDCILLPIGYAQGHEDQIPLKLIRDKCKSSPYLPEFNNIYDTIYAIKNSKMYLGSSLHGAITAISYSVQHSALTKNSKKLVSFLNTWNTTKYPYCDVKGLTEQFKVILDDNQDKKMVENRSKELIDLVEENLINIAELLIE